MLKDFLKSGGVEVEEEIKLKLFQVFSEIAVSKVCSLDKTSSSKFV